VRGITGADDLLLWALVDLEDDVEAAGSRLVAEGHGFGLIFESGQVDLEPSAGIAAELQARKPCGSRAVDDRVCRCTVASVTEDGFDPTDLLRLNALECD
jgi:hypothetical protein